MAARRKRLAGLAGRGSRRRGSHGDGRGRDSASRGGVVSESLDRLAGVFREVFDDDEVVVTPQTSAADVDGWDSLMHVNLMLSVEKEFGVRFSSSEVAMLQDVGELVGLIESKRGDDGQAL